jgi:hypothetical protein
MNPPHSEIATLDMALLTGKTAVIAGGASGSALRQHRSSRGENTSGQPGMAPTRSRKKRAQLIWLLRVVKITGPAKITGAGFGDRSLDPRGSREVLHCE